MKIKNWWILCLLNLSCLPLQVGAQTYGYTIHQEITQDSLIYYASNDNFCPYYIELQPQIDSIFFGEPHFFVIESKTNHKRITAYPKPTKQGKIDYRTYAFLGNPAQKPDTTHIYSLPYQPTKRYFIMQGYNGRFSHKNQYALDFKMKVGTPIHAARGGVVVKVKEDSDKGGRTSEFAQHGNHIVIYHEDGTLAYYFHLSKDGSQVEVGEQVKQGQFIGLSGNTGWSTAPHLHFIIKYTTKSGYSSVPTWFCTNKRELTRLKAWKKYRACTPKTKK